MDIIKTVIELIWSVFSGRRHVRVFVHSAEFINTHKLCFFINITNLSRNREVEITHVWIKCGCQIPVIQRNRPLPKRLKPDETWETWIEMDKVPRECWDDAYELARVRLSTGVVIYSKKNTTIPNTGNVPGGA